jgi:alpha-tubulin suppressor-like RCC1 family protein
VAGGLTWDIISGGYLHTCGKTVANISYCWGENSGGQLGDGNLPNDALAPVIVSGGLVWNEVSAGYQHSCGITTGGIGYCWGIGNNGELGDGLSTNTDTRTPVGGGLTFVSISAGTFYSCGLAVNNEVWCWGANSDGQLGDGTRISKNLPVQIVQ